jgi:lactoylglutathione lyase
VAAAWDAALAAGAIVVSPPRTKPWGQTVAYVRDLEGMLVEICTPVAS